MEMSSLSTQESVFIIRNMLTLQSSFGVSE